MPRETGLPMSGSGAEFAIPEEEHLPQVTVQADIGGMQVAFVELVPGSEKAKLDARLDLYRQAIDRQRAQQELVEALTDLRARQEALAQAPERERSLLKSRAEERVRLVAQWHAEYDARPHRVDFTLGNKHLAALHTFDEETDKKLSDECAACERIRAELPMYEARIARQRRIIAGATRAEVMEEEPLALAAE